MLEQFERDALYYNAEGTAEKIEQAAQIIPTIPDYPTPDDYLRFLHDVHGVKAKSYSFDSEARKFLSGTLFIDPFTERALISWNRDMPKNRQSFTKLHELYHYFQYIEGKVPIQQTNFNDLLSHRGYNEEEEPLEVEANFGASLLFLPTSRLEHDIAMGRSFASMSRMLGMSANALKGRLVEYLHYGHELNWDISSQIVNHYQSDLAPKEIQMMVAKDSEPFLYDMLTAVSEGKIYNGISGPDDLPF
ncbi:ImmA/IrrE family metallo-endopeptidase [Lacticaseibacillus saniviri]|uniref:ImmA/IrrE family metallo-endopeptidase n=1 Tax=Lacticaseibacillus saniviri TaxID=931533 RepID=UPI000704CCC9|nr:ImmA/IrrE family metallo-endopeptidase [Lacticaseibacillus saniviri]